MDSNTPNPIEQLLKQNFHNKKFKKAYQEEKTEFIKGLEAEIGDELRTRINEIKGKFILLVGKSVKASEAVGRYAHCIKGHTKLNFYSFSGKTDERIENILNDTVYDDGNDTPRTGKLIDCLSSDGAVFLGDLECHDRPLLKRLAEGIRNVKDENYAKGMLLVSTTTGRDSVPEYFKELFEVEVIELEPEKQGTPVCTPQDTAKHQAQVTPKDIEEIYYDDKAGILFVDKIPAKLTPTEKVFFERFWDKQGSVAVDDVIEHMTTFDEFNNTSWDRGYFDKTLSSINCKGKSLEVKKLIKNVNFGCGEYSISVKVKRKSFNP